MKKLFKKITAIIVALVIFTEFMPTIEAKAESHTYTVNSSDGSFNVGDVELGSSQEVTLAVESVSGLVVNSFIPMGPGWEIVNIDSNGGTIRLDTSTTGSKSCSVQIIAANDYGSIDVTYTVTWNVVKIDTLTSFEGVIQDYDFGGGINAAVVTKTDHSLIPGQTPLIQYKYQGAADSEYVGISPGGIIAPGQYTIRARYSGNETYNSSQTLEYNFEVNKVTPTLTIENTNPGVEPKAIITGPTMRSEFKVENIVADSFYNDKYEIKYKEASADDSTYSTTVPTKAGSYVAMYEPKETPLIYWHNSATTTFKINALDGKGSVKVADTVYGESSVKPVAESETNGKDNVIFYFKKKDADDSTYTKDVPKIPGKYTCKAVFPATGAYNEVVATCNFMIDKGKGIATVAATNSYVGAQAKVTPVSATNGIDKVTYYYKAKGSADSTYTTTVPSKPGDYVVKAVFATTDYYYPVEATSEFKVTYMPAPKFDLSGTKGKNSFYTSDVSIDAPAGYLISVSENGEFKSSVKLLNGNKYVYFKDAKTGALSDKVEIPSYKIDSVKPQAKGFKNGEKKYEDEFEIGIDDDNLESVTVNGTKIDIKNGSCSYVLKAEKKATEYKIVATDLAGNTITYVVTVIPEWMEDFIIPVGEEVTLEPNQQYNLSSGKWQVSGDDTVYSGGNSFYVKSEKNYTFTSK